MTVKMIGLTSRARLKHVMEDSTLPNGLVLDAGCGSGELLISLLLDGTDVVGLDRDIGQLEALRAAVKRMGEDSNLVAADVSHLPFRDSSFKALYCLEVINMLGKDEYALKEFARTIEQDGICTLSVPYAGYPIIYDPLNKILERKGLRHRQLGIWSPGVKRLYEPFGLLLRLRSIGMNPVRLHYVGKWLIPLLENYVSLLLYYKVLAAKFRGQYALQKERGHSALVNALSKVLDYIVKLDDVPDLYGTHFIINARKL